MRVGLLTLHLQLNYGGVLQAWAGQCALEGLGHEVCVLDRWLDPRNLTLLGPFGAVRSAAVRNLLCEALAYGQFGAFLLRHWRTIRFVRRRFRLSPYHFYRWQDVAGRELGVDCVMVGSDQVWHCGDWGDPAPYLLEGAPQGLPAVAYAASFGMREIPEAWREAFRAGFRRFAAIGVREAEGVGLAARLGGTATHVLDPTQLVPAKVWRERLGLRPKRGRRPRLFCYFLSENVPAAWPHLEAFVRRTGFAVEIFGADTNFVRRLPPKALFRHLANLPRRTLSPVRVRLSSGPREFLQALANSDAVVSDSFHALMFASLFGKNVRILRPRNAGRQAMFARIEEFARLYTQGPVIADDLPAALTSLAAGETVAYDEPALEAARCRSLDWLRKALGKAVGVPTRQGKSKT